MVLVSALLHAGWNALLKREVDARASAIVVIAGAALLSGVLALVIGPNQVPSAGYNAVLLSGAIEVVYFVSLSGALVRLPLQTAYGLSRGLGMLLVWPLSMWLMDERATDTRLVGAALLSLGLLCLVERGRSVSGLLLAVLSAITIAGYPLAYKAALHAGVAPYSLFSLSLVIGLSGTFAILGANGPRRIAHALRGRAAYLGFCSVICCASFLLFLHALQSEG